MEQLEGFNTCPPSHICKLIQDGLKQSGRIWNLRYYQKLIKLGLAQLPTEPCIYMLKAKGETGLVVAIYVDDIIITGPDEAVIVKFEGLLTGKFKMSEGRNLGFVLGVRVMESQGGRLLDQKHFAVELLEKYGMLDARPVVMPVEPGAIEVLAAANGTEKDCNKKYSEANGSLMWLSMMARPGMAFTTLLLEQFTASPSVRYWGIVKRALKVPLGNHGLWNMV